MARALRIGDSWAMAKITIDVPDDVAVRLKELEAKLKELEADKTGTAPPIAEADVDSVTAGIALELKRRSLQGLDIDAKRILVDGKPHAKVGRYEAHLFTKEGPVSVTRSLYRECGARNAKTVDPVSLRLGLVENWLPNAAKAAAFLLQQGTSREAEATARALGVLPYSRSSFERISHEVGSLHTVVRDEVEESLIGAYEIPAAARSISVSLDRVAVPMEEPRKRPVGRPKRGAPRRPVERAWRMAYVGTVTLHDVHGDALHTIRYGRMPGLGGFDVIESMTADVETLLGRRPKLKVALLCDGSQEMVDLLDMHLNAEELGCTPHRLVDFWHVVEKLGAAARVIHGTDADVIVKRWKMLLLNSTSATSRILRELEASGKRSFIVDDAQPVHAAITYLTNQGPRMNYVAARTAGLPIGSGNVEATCKSLFGQRLVRTGSRWKESTAQHIVDLRALALSDRFVEGLALTLRPLVHQVRRAA